MKEHFQVIPAPENTFAVWKADSDYWVARVWGFDCFSSFYPSKEDWITQVTPLSGNFIDGVVESSNQIVFVGSQEECKKEESRLNFKELQKK